MSAGRRREKSSRWVRRPLQALKKRKRPWVTLGTTFFPKCLRTGEVKQKNRRLVRPFIRRFLRRLLRWWVYVYLVLLLHVSLQRRPFHLIISTYSISHTLHNTSLATAPFEKNGRNLPYNIAHSSRLTPCLQSFTYTWKMETMEQANQTAPYSPACSCPRCPSCKSHALQFGHHPHPCNDTTVEQNVTIPRIV